MVKKVTLLACLAIAAAVVVPVASANAAALVGTCTIEGTATFPEKLPPNGKLAHRTYTFTDEGKGSCTGTEGTNGPKINEAIKEAKVEGKGELACLVSENEATLSGETLGNGTGKLVLASGKTFEFNKFTFVAAAGDVNFTGSAIPATEGAFGGTAEFATNSNATVLKECASGEPEEVGSLGFTAVATGAI
jgi:hypothetical protein